MMAEGPDISFVMHGARDAILNGLTHIEQQVNVLEEAISQNPNFTFDLAKALIESVCRTILFEREVEFTRDEDLPSLFRKVRRNLPFLPTEASHESDVRRSLDQTLNGLHTTIQGISELRNSVGFASHGSEAARAQMESTQALMVAQAADTIVGFLYRVHMQGRTPVLLYNQNGQFNDFVDDRHETVRIFDVEFAPSYILFQMEPDTYRIHMTNFGVEDVNTVDDGMEPDCG